MTLSRYLLVGAVLAAVLVLAGCSPGGETEAATSSPAAAPSPTSLPVPPAEGLPDYAYRSADALRGYEIAVAEQELVSRLPCYCGCGQDPKFKSLLSCFMDENGEFNSHGANCQVCLEEAEDAFRWKAEGHSTKQIRGLIDTAYEGRGDPTDTAAGGRVSVGDPAKSTIKVSGTHLAQPLA